MKVYIVFKKQWSGSYEDVDVDASVLLVTEDKAKFERLLDAAELLGCRGDIFTCERELE